MTKNGIAGLVLAVVMMAGAPLANATESTPCQDSAKALAKALSAAAFGRDAVASEITFDGADENAHYRITVTSKPFEWGDGTIRPSTLTYVVRFDNDSDVQCSLIEAKLQ